MSVRYCQQCGAELDDDTSYCPECGTAVGDDYETTDNATSIENDSWDWSDPYGPFQSPRRALGTVNLLGVVTFLFAVVGNALGYPITVLPEPLPIALFLFWFGIIFFGFPLWVLLHVSDNVLGFLKQG